MEKFHVPPPADAGSFEDGPEHLFAAWVRIWEISHARIARNLRCSKQQVSRYLRPLGHRNHDRPGHEKSDRLKLWTGGGLHAGNVSDVYDPADPNQVLPPAPSSDLDDGAILNTGAAKAERVPGDIQ